MNQASRRNAMRLMVNLIFDPDYKGYVADVPELPGCMSQGKTIELALKNVKEAILLYLETTPRRHRGGVTWGDWPAFPSFPACSSNTSGKATGLESLRPPAAEDEVNAIA
jgi:predicted RNase H-like HicB family nuclease